MRAASPGIETKLGVSGVWNISNRGVALLLMDLIHDALRISNTGNSVMRSAL